MNREALKNLFFIKDTGAPKDYGISLLVTRLYPDIPGAVDVTVSTDAGPVESYMVPKETSVPDRFELMSLDEVEALPYVNAVSLPAATAEDKPTSLTKPSF